jgi:hypothetical protein
MSREEVDRALDRLQAEQDAISAALLALDDHPGYRFLKGAELTGVTLQRWTAAQALISALWQQFDTYKRTLESATALRARRARPSPTDLSELTGILTGVTAVLTGAEIPLERRGLLGPERLTESLTLDALVERMNTAYKAAAQILADTDNAWSGMMERLAPAEDAWRTADRLLRSLGEEPGGSPAALAVTRIGQEIAAVRRVVRSDPLSLWRGGAADTGRLERAAAELTALRPELERAASIRADFDEQSKRLEALIDSTEAACGEARRAQELVREKIASPATPAIPARTAALRSRLAELAELSRLGRWTELGAAATRLERDAAAALEEAHAVRDEIGALLRRRDELRGLLGAYQAKATRLGHGEDLGLAALFQRARDLLWTAPCDLEQADTAAARYQAAVNGIARQYQPGGAAPHTSREGMSGR